MLPAARVVFAGDRDVSVFGSAQRSAGALIGIFYNSKQDQKREPVPMDRHQFEKLVARFIPGTRLPDKWFSREPEVQLSGKYGGRFTPGDRVDLDIILGESPGGQTRCQIAVEKKGVETIMASCSPSS